MEERFEVLEGRAALRVDGIPIDTSPRTVLIAPPGRRHLAWNPTDGPVQLRIDLRPFTLTRRSETVSGLRQLGTFFRSPFAEAEQHHVLVSRT